MPSFGNLPSVCLYLSKPSILPLRRLLRRGLDSAGGENIRRQVEIRDVARRLRAPSSERSCLREHVHDRNGEAKVGRWITGPPTFAPLCSTATWTRRTSQSATPAVKALEAEHAQWDWTAAEPSYPILGWQRCQTLNRSAIQEHRGVKVGLVRQPSNGGAQKI
jgi:hypothetical protein